MNPRQWILWKPAAGQRGVLLVAAIGLTLLIEWIHYLSGLAYEFHVFFGVPLLPGMDDTAALPYVQDLRQRLLDAMQANAWPVTFSIGVASYRQAPENFDALITRADALMYEVKESGRNRILQRVPDGAVS